MEKYMNDAFCDFEKSHPLSVNIETINYCNRKCSYCFWRYYDVPKTKIMSLELFERILIEISTMERNIKFVSFVAYNEPTIDPFFINRLDLLKSYNLKFWNITNATNLSKKITDYFISNIDLMLRFICIDLPAADYSEMEKLTMCSKKQYNRLMSNLDYFGKHIKNYNINANITVLGWNDQEHEKNMEAVKYKFETYGYNVSKGFLSDRAGQLRPYVNNRFYIENPKGCNCGGDRINDHLHFGVNGNLFLCCQDFHQAYSYGNILDKSLADVLSSPERIDAIRRIRSGLCRNCCFAR